MAVWWNTKWYLARKHKQMDLQVSIISTLCTPRMWNVAHLSWSCMVGWLASVSSQIKSNLIILDHIQRSRTNSRGREFLTHYLCHLQDHLNWSSMTDTTVSSQCKNTRLNWIAILNGKEWFAMLKCIFNQCISIDDMQLFILKYFDKKPWNYTMHWEILVASELRWIIIVIN